MARVVREAVSDAIMHHLSDPRIEGFVSITRVEVATDLRNADVFISVFGKNPASQNKTFAAINHAKSRIQSLLAGRMQSKFCPVLHFYTDDKFKKTLETMELIDKAAKELKEKDLDEEDKGSERPEM